MQKNIDSDSCCFGNPQPLIHYSGNLAIDAHLTKPARASQLLDSIVNAMSIVEAKQPKHMPGQADTRLSGTAMFIDELTATEKTKITAASVIAGNAALNKQSAGADTFMDDVRTGEQIEILVAEDNEVNQMVFEQILEYLGYKFKIVENGKLAVDQIDQLRPAIVLMDVSMPVMNGLDATIEIRSMYDGADNSAYRPVIIGVTAHALKDDREKCINSGMDDYLSKPVSPDMLAEKISQWMQKTNYNRDIA